ncbi:hypothetical protein VTL71DRAFT_3552 [Oculimacula yallundae]|uniref:Zn(2)-C6 fungal-type domain-containing protein n=1 Tax=Oculimacula yallundae TaxID=86028 RepID=A0ABR4C8N4_9HELO
MSPNISNSSSSSTSPSDEIVLTERSATTTNPSKTRKSKPKVKTGCLTCKIRRVKCDEGKPHCERCFKAGLTCDGYKQITKTVARSRQRPIILPKKVAIPRTSSAVTSIRTFYSGVGFEDPLDGQCFRIFLEETSSEVSGTFPSTLWGRLIPQISELEPFVRHAVLAIGALGKESRYSSQKSSLGTFTRGSDYHFALQHYDKSLRGMREAIAAGQHDLRKALIACLLVFCFEGMLGNQAAAAIHAQRGLMLLHHWTAGNNPSGTPLKTEKIWRDRLFEEDLLEAFNALDSQVLLFIDTREKAVHGQIKTRQNSMIQNMPGTFKSLSLSRQFWQLIMNRNYHFCKSIQHTDIEELKEKRKDSEWEGSVDMKHTELLLSDAQSGPWHLREEHLRYRGDIFRWLAAFETLYEQILAGENEREKACARILQVQARASNIMLAGTFFTTECEYDIFLPEFNDIVILSRSILPYIQSTYNGTAPRFNVDIGIVAALFLVGSRCRDDPIRQRAIDMLFAANYREGIWDALAVAHVARWLRSLEIKDMEPSDWIPEEKRAVLSAINIDLYRKREALGAVQKTKDGVVESKTVVVW